jgi:hypothetical protein
MTTRLASHAKRWDVPAGTRTPSSRDRLARGLDIRQHFGVHVDHDLVALARRAGIDAVVERGLGEECQRVGLLLRHRRRLRGNRRDVNPRLPMQSLARGGQGLHQQRADFRRQPASDGDRAVLVLIHVQCAAGVLTIGLAKLGLVVHPTPASDDPLDVLGRAGTAHRQQSLFRLRRGHARELAHLGVGELAAGERLRQSRQGAERAGHPDVFPGRPGREADTPGEPGGTGPEAGVPATAGVELPDEIEQARGGSVEVRA